jgi:hypothetical protein
MAQEQIDIFERMLKGGTIDIDDPQLPKIWEGVAATIKLSASLNHAQTIDEIRERLSEIIGKAIDISTTVFVPFIPILESILLLVKTFLSITLAAF